MTPAIPRPQRTPLEATQTLAVATRGARPLRWLLRAAWLITLLAPGARAEILAGNSPNSGIDRIDSLTGAFLGQLVSPSSGGLSRAMGMGVGADGNLYVSSRFTDNVLRYDGVTGAFIDACVPSISVPAGLQFGPGGDLFVVSNGSHAVMRYAAGSCAPLGVFASGGLSFPTDLAFGPGGDLFVSSSFNNRVVRFDGVTGASKGVFASGGLSNAQGLAFHPGNGDLFVASYDGDRVIRYDGTSGAHVGTFVAPGSGGLNQPMDIEFGPNGDLHVKAGSGSSGNVLVYDGMTGAFLKSMGGASSGQGFLLFRDDAADSGVTAYCVQTKPTSVAGCFATLSAPDKSLATGSWDSTNIPRSATAGDGNSLGIYIYTNGPSAGQSAFGTTLPYGVLCLQGFMRSAPSCSPVSLSTIAGTCNTGVMSLSLSCNAGALGLAVGDDVNVQFWYRDPTATTPGNANLSNAIYYTLE